MSAKLEAEITRLQLANKRLMKSHSVALLDVERCKMVIRKLELSLETIKSEAEFMLGQLDEVK